mgnify:CR=1 FL=1
MLRVVKESVEAGEDPIEVLGLAGGIGQIVGEHFEKGEYFFQSFYTLLRYSKRLWRSLDLS